MNQEEICKKIREIRIEKGFSQKYIGEKCGLTQQAINRIEHSGRKIDIELLSKISSALEVPIQEIYECMPIDLHKTTEEYKTTMKKVKAYEGILDILQHIYGSVEEKNIDSEYGETFYYLIGKGKDSFVLYEGDIDELTDYACSCIPFMVEKMKDARPEQEIIDEIVSDLNSPECIAVHEKYLKDHNL